MSVKVASKLAIFSVFACLAIACGASEEEDTDSDDAALSDSTCRPRAEAAEKAATKKCQDENPVLDWTKCMEPADKAFTDYQAQLAAARTAVQNDINSITGACKTSVDRLDVDKLITDALPRISDFAREQMKRNAKQIAMLREQRKTKCDEEAKGALEEALGSDNAYVTLVKQAPEKNRAHDGAVLSCAARGAVAWVKNASCKPVVASTSAAYQSAYATCRHTCNALSEAACSPTDYKGGGVLCGKLVNERGFNWRAGMTCEETAKCQRTAICDKYDSLKEKADDLNEEGSCDAGNGAAGVLIAVVEKDSKGRATDVKTQCKTTTASK